MEARLRRYKRVWIDINGLKASFYRLVREEPIEIRNPEDVDKAIEGHSILAEALRREAEKAGEAYIVELILESDAKEGRQVKALGSVVSKEKCSQASPSPIPVKRVSVVEIPVGSPVSIDAKRLRWVDVPPDTYVYDLCVKNLRKPVVFIFETTNGEIRAAIIRPGGS